METTSSNLTRVSTQRMRVTVRGAVQGVGFRPFVYRLATELDLRGWVSNSSQGVFMEVEGPKQALSQFLMRLGREIPPRSFIQSLEHSILDPTGYGSFTIRESETSGEKSTLVLADSATCPECLREIFDPSNRRYLYPFTNCTHCGPRFTIIESLPYDRPNTTMRVFELCDDCRREYADPRDRRFHAQPNACPQCGPHLELWKNDGETVANNHMALLVGADIIRRGGILAVKGLGGFHLVVDARSEHAVQLLRKRKRREEKPLALMYPSLSDVKADCVVSDLEERLMLSAEAPIVLLERKSTASLASSIAPSNPYLGAMLPYTPLHHILMQELGFPIVATSGNISDEPICTDEHEALDRLHDIADAFLVHNRPIVRHVDDSVVRVMAGREMMVRRARGYAPLPVHVRSSLDIPLLAVGAHQKNSVALNVGENIFVSQHIGDLETGEAFDAFQDVSRDLQQLYGARPEHVVCDMHPDYLSTKFASGLDIPSTSIQHHHAHIASCMAENELDGRVLGVSWDGTGYGPDGTIWGGEFLLTDATSYSRVASLRPFRLPGGDRAAREPRRAALGLLYEILGDSLFERNDILPLQSFALNEIELLRQMLSRNVNSPLTSSMGRVFDAVAAIIGLRQQVNFEGQAAMELEFSIGSEHCEEQYQFEITDCGLEKGGFLGDRPPALIDWSCLVSGVLDDFGRKERLSVISSSFHNTLCEMIVRIAKRTGEHRVVLSGGCFQNKYLTERAIRRLQEEGFRPYWHQRVPTNDGGIALGQVYAYARSRTADMNDEHEFEFTEQTYEHSEEETVR